MDILVEQSTFNTSFFGVYLDEGTTGTTVRESTFVNACWAAIGDYKGSDNLYDTSGNVYQGIAAGAVPITKDHYSRSDCPPWKRG